MGLEQKIRAVLRARVALPVEVPFFEELLTEVQRDPALVLSPAQRAVLDLRHAGIRLRVPR